MRWLAGVLRISPLRRTMKLSCFGREDGMGVCRTMKLSCFGREDGLGVCRTKKLSCFGGKDARGRWNRFAAGALIALSASVGAYGAAGGLYSAPVTDARVLRGIDFSRAQVVDPQLTALYQACDQSRERGGCYTDQAHNTAVLRFEDGTVFFDAKMAIDADGSALSKRAEHPNQPETAFRYPDPAGLGQGPSLDSERVPYVVMPMGDFRRDTGVSLGDLVAVIKDGQVHFALVGDVGPRTHIGEASMKLHTEFGRHICTAYDLDGNCSAFTDTSIDPPVLYFLFPDTRKLIIDGLTEKNINERIATVGGQVWNSFLTRQRAEKEKE